MGISTARSPPPPPHPPTTHPHGRCPGEAPRPAQHQCERARVRIQQVGGQRIGVCVPAGAAHSAGQRGGRLGGRLEVREGAEEGLADAAAALVGRPGRERGGQGAQLTAVRAGHM